MKKIILLTLLSTLIAFAGDMKSLKVGEAVPTFTLKNYDGKEVSLDTVAKAHKLTVLMFISTECPVSNGYNERMVNLNDQFGKKNVAFLGINANVEEDVARIAEHSKEKGFKFPVLKDVGNKIADAYGAMVTPEIFVVNSEGKLLYHGRIDNSPKDANLVQTTDLRNAIFV